MKPIKRQTIHDMFDLYPDEDLLSILFWITGSMSKRTSHDDLAVKIGLDHDSSIERARSWFKQYEGYRLYIVYEKHRRMFFPSAIVIAVKKGSYKDIAKYFEAFGAKLRQFHHVEALKKIHES